MTKKQRKALKREHIALARKTQDQWIEHFGLEAPASRRQRDHRFNAAQKISLILQGIPHAAA